MSWFLFSPYASTRHCFLSGNDYSFLDSTAVQIESAETA